MRRRSELIAGGLGLQEASAYALEGASVAGAGRASGRPAALAHLDGAQAAIVAEHNSSVAVEVTAQLVSAAGGAQAGANGLRIEAQCLGSLIERDVLVR